MKKRRRESKIKTQAQVINQQSRFIREKNDLIKALKQDIEWLWDELRHQIDTNEELRVQLFTVD